MAFVFASCWPIQLLLLVIFVLLFTIGIEFWRRYTYINFIIFIILMIISIPFLFYRPRDDVLFMMLKFYALVPVLICCTMLRIIYNPSTLPLSTRKWKLWNFIKMLFCITIPINHENTQNTSKCAEWFFYFMFFLNFIIAIILLDFVNGYPSLLNTICAFILVLTIPFPAKILYPQHSYYVDENGDFLVKLLGVLWIICYSSWNYSLLYNNYHSNVVFYNIVHILPPLIYCAVYKRTDLWFVARVYSLSLCIIIFTPFIDDWKIYVLHGSNFPIFEEIHSNKFVFVVWDSINIIMAVIYAIMWIKKIKRIRAITQTNDSDVGEAVTDKENVQLLNVS